MPSSDTELTNFKCGIDVWFGGTKGVDYAEEYFFGTGGYDPTGLNVFGKQISDRKVVYLRDTTTIHMETNAFNSAFYIFGTGRMHPIGKDGLDGVADSGDEGIIRYKIDRDLQYWMKWADTTAYSETARVLPAYSAPFTLASQTYDGSTPVVGTTGSNGGTASDRSSRYFRGCLDPFGDEWHVLSYAHDDNVFQRAKFAATGQFIDQAWYVSDGKTCLLVVNPKTPCLTIRGTGTAQWYTTPPKAYWVPKVVAQTTYFAPGASGSLTFDLADIYGRNISYRINGGSWVSVGASTVTLTDAAFATGTNTLEYRSAGYEANAKTRTIVKNPTHPSATEPHGERLVIDAAGWNAIYARSRRGESANPNRKYSFRYNRLLTQDEAGQGTWDANALRGRRFNGSTTVMQSSSFAMQNATVAKIEGVGLGSDQAGFDLVRSGTTKSFGRYAIEMLLDHARTIDPLGFELAHTSDAIPTRELHYRGYYDAGAAMNAAFAYDIVAGYFRSDQVTGGMTAIEDYFIRDTLAGFAYEAMQWTAHHCILGAPKMWGSSRIMTGSHIAMIMPNYSTPYYGTSGFGSVQTTYPWCPYETDQLTWKKALFDCDAPKTAFPNYKWGLGLSDADPESVFTSANQVIGGNTWPLGTFSDKKSYFGGLYGPHLQMWAFMARVYGNNRTDARMEIALENAVNGTLYGAVLDSGSYGPTGAWLYSLMNAYFPEYADVQLPTILATPSTTESGSIDGAMQGGSVTPLFLLHDDYESGSEPPPPPPPPVPPGPSYVRRIGVTTPVGIFV